MPAPALFADIRVTLAAPLLALGALAAAPAAGEVIVADANKHAPLPAVPALQRVALKALGAGAPAVVWAWWLAHLQMTGHHPGVERLLFKATHLTGMLETATWQRVGMVKAEAEAVGAKQ